VSDDVNWLDLWPVTGSSTGEIDNVTLSVDITGMSAGSHSATITISAPGATNTPQTVPVSLTINPLLVADILSYYRGLDGDPTNVSDEDLLQAAYDWAHHVIPNGFDQWLSDIELLQLAKEWATNTPQMVPASLTIMGEDTKVHIVNIDMGLTSTWWGWRTYATATVSIADAQGNPVAGATLSGHWEGTAPDTDSGGTDSQGRVKLSSNAVWKASGTRFTFTVDNVTKGGWTYNPEANIETTDSIVKEPSGFFSRIWLLLKSFIQRLGSIFSEVIKL